MGNIWKTLGQEPAFPVSPAAGPIPGALGGVGVTLVRMFVLFKLFSALFEQTQTQATGWHRYLTNLL